MTEQQPLSRFEQAAIIIALCLATAPFGLFGIDAGAQDATLVYRNMLWMGVYALFAALFFLHARIMPAIFANGKTVMALTAFATFSAAWSEMPGATLSSSIGLWASTLIAGYIALRAEPAQMLRLSAIALGIISIGSLLVVLLLPEYGIMSGLHEGAWRGLFTQKNILGRYMTLATAALWAAGYYRLLPRLPAYALALLGLVILWYTRSVTAYVMLGIFVMLFTTYSLSQRFSSWLRIAFISLVLTLGTVTALLFSDPTATQEILGWMGRDATFTQRTQIWELAFKAISERPWLGYGYGVFWESDVGQYYTQHFLNWQVPHVHNGFIETCLGIGLIGTALLMVLVAQLLVIALKPPANPAMRTLQALALTSTLVLNLVEVTFLRYNNLFWMLAIYLLIRLRAESRMA